MPSTCKFAFNKPGAAYFSGEIIAGIITLNTTSEKSVRDVSIIFLGEANVDWEEPLPLLNCYDSDSDCSIDFSSHEVYVDNSTMVHGDGVLPVGTHTFRFNIPLPPECPTSCEGKYGYVRYTISLKINRYYRFDNIFKRRLIITKAVDLNSDPAYKIPIVLETTKNLCCWPCSKGTIFCTLQIPFGAYASGQTFKYALHIMNQSESDTQGYTIEFNKIMIFTALSPYRKIRTSKYILVFRSFSDQCLSLTNRTLEGDIFIPATPPTTPRSSIVCVEYKLKVTLHLPGCSSNTAMEVPIVMGTIPLSESLPTDENSITAPSEAVEPSAPAQTPAKLNSVDADLPSSHNDKMGHFSPPYPMFNARLNGK